MLNQLNPGEEEAAEYALLKDLNSVCRQMQSRLVELIEQVSSEEITCELLRVNDELNQVFVRYDRYERIREIHMKKSQATAQNSILMSTDSRTATASRNKTSTDLFDGGDPSFDVPVLPSTVPVVRKRADAPPQGANLPPVRSTNMPQLSSNLDVMTLEDPEGGASGGFGSAGTAIAASNPTYEELLFTGSTQTTNQSSLLDGFGDVATGGAHNGTATANGGGLSEQDIESFLNDEAAAPNRSGNQPVTVKPAQSFLNPFES